MAESYCDAYPEDDIDIFKGMTILVVDDTNDFLLLTTYILESYGFRVMTASNASTAFEVLKQFRVDLLISDIAMPEEDGYFLIQKLRKLPQFKTREIPAIAFSGCAEGKTRSKALASGFQTYLQKPCSQKQLITEVAKLLLLKSHSSPQNDPRVNCCSPF
ncbi:response regulator [Nostoc foliaceum]|uniref:response regulator n=1 Tax=Nostoc foliaceum TaxID=2692914 RepID=UPI0028BEA271|nr:response regulator [Nostoc foliaceum]